MAGLRPASSSRARKSGQRQGPRRARRRDGFIGGLFSIHSNSLLRTEGGPWRCGPAYLLKRMAQAFFQITFASSCFKVFVQTASTNLDDHGILGKVREVRELRVDFTSKSSSGQCTVLDSSRSDSKYPVKASAAAHPLLSGVSSGIWYGESHHHKVLWITLSTDFDKIRNPFKRP